ncbi:5'-nucleotidase C-terminal domain-containing protein, partial [Acinetobacter baumannii]
TLKGDVVSAVTVAGRPVDLDANYSIAFNSFTAGGGDKHAVLAAAKGKRTDTGIVDLDALISFIKAQSPVQASYEGRIRR